jgi:hypothetical protein
VGSLKEKLYEELKLKLALYIEGVSYDEGVFETLINKDRSLKKTGILHLGQRAGDQKKALICPILLLLKMDPAYPSL